MKKIHYLLFAFLGLLTFSVYPPMTSQGHQKIVKNSKIADFNTKQVSDSLIFYQKATSLIMELKEQNKIERVINTVDKKANIKKKD